MPSYLTQENGDRLLLEDGTGALLLEQSPAPSLPADGGSGGKRSPVLRGHDYSQQRRPSVVNTDDEELAVVLILMGAR